MRLYLLGLLAVAACSNPTTENTPDTHPLYPDSVGTSAAHSAQPAPASAAADSARNLPPAEPRP